MFSIRFWLAAISTPIAIASGQYVFLLSATEQSPDFSFESLAGQIIVALAFTWLLWVPAIFLLQHIKKNASLLPMLGLGWLTWALGYFCLLSLSQDSEPLGFPLFLGTLFQTLPMGVAFGFLFWAIAYFRPRV